MKVAVVGSRSLVVLLSGYIPEGTTEIISGGARGVETCARMYAELNGIYYREITKDCKTYGKRARKIRNNMLIDSADMLLVFWNGKSRDNKYVIDRCGELDKPVRVYTVEKEKLID